MRAPATPPGPGPDDREPGRDWTVMTAADFGKATPAGFGRGGPAAVPAEPDECGTAALFGDETPAPPLRPVAVQDELF
ncbi:hypothetical protein OG723_44455 (plasmid) [Streptomyces sp. NBC_01278]|uniref:hypothetical protein n=1 Tax=Streptomyces sp. NBC_01278 TaxID=2903809 RepID=UPI002E358639|nr:hypothetical protein [Streptomyces sp. NBC_01278]